MAWNVTHNKYTRPAVVNLVLKVWIPLSAKKKFLVHLKSHQRL